MTTKADIEKARKDEVYYFIITFVLGIILVILSYIGLALIMFIISLTKYIDMRYWDLIRRKNGDEE